jgi:hypothetical protein
MTPHLRYLTHTDAYLLDRISRDSSLVTLTIARHAISLTVTLPGACYPNVTVTGTDRRDVLERACAAVDNLREWEGRDAA